MRPMRQNVCLPRWLLTLLLTAGDGSASLADEPGFAAEATQTRRLDASPQAILHRARTLARDGHQRKASDAEFDAMLSDLLKVVAETTHDAALAQYFQEARFLQRLVGSDMDLGHLNRALVVVDGSVHIGFAQDSLIVATGGAHIAHGNRNLVIAGHYIHASHDGNDIRFANGPNRRSVLISGGSVDVSHAYRTVCAARREVQISHATEVTFLNSPRQGLSHRRDCRELFSPRLDLPASTHNPLADRLAVTKFVYTDDFASRHVVFRRKNQAGDDQAWIGRPIVDANGKPIAELKGWKLTLVERDFALFHDGERFASFWKPR